MDRLFPRRPSRVLASLDNSLPLSICSIAVSSFSPSLYTKYRIPSFPRCNAVGGPTGRRWEKRSAGHIERSWVTTWCVWPFARQPTNKAQSNGFLLLLYTTALVQSVQITSSVQHGARKQRSRKQQQTTPPPTR
jgi:hypothetical protein